MHFITRPLSVMKIVGLGLVLAVFLTTSGIARAADVRIGFIDIQKAAAETKEFQREFTRFRSKFKKEQELIGAREKKIKDMLQTINKQGFALKEQEKRSKEEAFLKEKKDFERYVQDKNEEFQRQEKAITDNILKKMLDVLVKLGKERNYTMILEKKAVFYSDTAADLTSIATKTYDKLYK